jgi:hypothetical protein
MIEPNFLPSDWRTSSATHDGASCVKVGCDSGRIGVVDSNEKRPEAPVLSFDARTWQMFISAIKSEGPARLAQHPFADGL